MIDITVQNFKNKEKVYKETKDLYSLQRLIEELKIESIKTNFQVSKGACYRFNSMHLCKIPSHGICTHYLTGT